MFVRTAGKRDLPAIRDLLVETRHATYDDIYGRDRVTEITGDRDSIEALGARLEKPRSEFIVADDGAQIGGVAFATTDEGGKTLLLHQLFVRPAFQGRGIGGLLLDEIETAFPEAGTVRIEVEDANARAVAFLIAQGFSEIGRTPDHGGAGASVPGTIYERAIVWVD